MIETLLVSIAYFIAIPLDSDELQRKRINAT